VTGPLRLTLSDAQLHALTVACTKARKGTTTIRVELAALEALIVDHGRALRLVPHDVPREHE
jgi:hypothetical protein